MPFFKQNRNAENVGTTETTEAVSTTSETTVEKQASKEEEVPGGVLAPEKIETSAKKSIEESNKAKVDEKKVWDALREVIDPELGWDIVSLGLVYDVAIYDDSVQVVMTLTTQGCPMGDMITNGVQQAVYDVEGVRNVSVDLVWSPRWDPMMMSEEAQMAFRVRG